MNDPILIAAVLLVAAVAVCFLLLRGERVRAEAAARMAQLSQSWESLVAAQADLAGQMKMAQSVVNERLETLAKRLGDGLSEQTEKTGKTLQVLHERLAVIDTAQKNLTDLSQNVVDLQSILSNKQSRGAFGQMRLEDLVSDVLPPANVVFEATLSNGKRVDCLIKLPNPPGSIAIDSKFPLEGYRLLADAQGEEQTIKARRQMTVDTLKHVKDIAEKYIIPGETADWALMFLPSEAVYCELQANFPEVIAEAYRRKVAIVSPTTLWATLNTVRAILKDARMREQASLIQKEVEIMLGDIVRLDKRVGNLQRHFEQAGEDLREIRISTERVIKRSDKIRDASLEEEIKVEAPLPPPPIA